MLHKGFSKLGIAGWTYERGNLIQATIASITIFINQAVGVFNSHSWANLTTQYYSTLDSYHNAIG